jgi:hypothetical protein
MADLAYLQEDGWTCHHLTLGSGDVVRLGGRDVRRERTGIHGMVGLSFKPKDGAWVTLAYSTFNIERDEERLRLSNSAHKLMAKSAPKEDMGELPAETLKHRLDVFCQGLWGEVVRGAEGELMGGDDSLRMTELVQGLVVEGGGSIFFAPPGRNKTTLMLMMAVCLDAGVSLPGIFDISTAKRGLFINLERSRQSLAYRLARTNRVLGLPPERQMAFMNARGRTLSDIYEAAARTMEKHQLEVVYLDSLSRAGAGSMSDDDVANKTMDRLNALAPTWALAAHTPRADVSHVFGSQMFDAAADICVQLLSQPGLEVSGLGLQVTKVNDIPLAPLKVLALEWAAGGLARVRLARNGEFSEIEAGRKVSLVQQVIELLLLRGAMDCDRIAYELGSSRPYINTIVKHDERFVETRDGHRILYAVKMQGTLSV